jgi:hypothetical protein
VALFAWSIRIQAFVGKIRKVYPPWSDPESTIVVAANIEGVSRRPNGIGIRLALSPHDFG